MSKFTSTKRINSRWRNNDFIGEPGSSHTFADALHEEFLVDWAHQIQIGDIVITETPTTGNIQMSTLTVGDIVVTGTATGNFGAQGTVVQGTAPISVSTSSNTATVSLNASYSTSTHLHDGTYQPFGTYVTSVTGTAPITASGTTAVTIGVDQTAITANSATNAEVVRFLVKNTTGTSIPKGSAVYVSGATGDNALISLAAATADPTSSKTLGLTAEAIANDAFGYVIEAGYITGIDTSTATAGAAVWLGNTPGSIVFVSPPAEPSHAVYLGVVTRVQVNNGSILVKVQNGYELDELHDVSAGTPTDGDIIQYKNTSGLWTKQSISQAGIAASVHTHAYANTVHTHATSDVTSGNFVATLGAGTGVTVTGADGNASAKTVAIGQAVATNSTPTFAGLTVNGDITSTYLPIRIATGTYSMSSSAAATGNTTVTFPANRFTLTPHVNVTIFSAPGGSQKVIARIAGTTTSTSFTGYWYSGDQTNLTFTGCVFGYIATQYSSSSAAG